MKTIPELRDAVVKNEEGRSKLGQPITTVRVDLKHIEQTKLEAKAGGFTIQIDEPAERGGTNTAPAPLNYFIMGAASCFLMQLVKVSMMKNLNVDGIEVIARGHLERVKKRKFTDIIYDITLIGSESPGNATELLHQAEEMCFVHQTLKDAIPVTSNMSLNGTPLTSHTLGPKGDSPFQ